MKKKLFYYLSSLLVSALILSSCSDDDNDTQKPIIGITNPVKGAEVYIGEILTVTADLSDNEELSEYKIDIHYNGDGHSHSKATEATEFRYNKDFQDAKGKKSAKVEVKIDIPIDIKTGNYHLGIICFDKSGNENHQYIDIVITERIQLNE